MSTSMVVQLTGEPEEDDGPLYEDFLVVTVRENEREAELRQALRRVSQSSLFTDDEELDEIEMRAAISSELKAEGLQLTGLQVVQYAFLGD